MARLDETGPRDPGARSRAVEARAAIASAGALLLDWDGCVAFGDRLEPSAVQLIGAHLGKVAIVSNNTTHLPGHFLGLLGDAGLSLPPARVLLAGFETLRRAAELRPARTLLLADSRMKLAARRMGINLVREDAEVVVLLRDLRFSYGRLERAANSLRKGARLLVGNPDLTHPEAKARVVPETGALLAALMACVDPAGVSIEIVGKPQPALFEMACRELGVGFGDALMIGDNAATDIAGAEGLGVQGLLVGPQSGLTLADLAPSE